MNEKVALKGMLKKLTALTAVLVLLLSLASPVRAQGNLSIVQSSAISGFPQTLTFNISTQSSADITDIRLHYVIEHQSFASITSEVAPDFNPGRKVDASWTLEMVRLGGLPPGTVVNYWWTASDATGGRIDSPKAQVRLEDKRFSWKSVSDSGLTLYWYDGNDAFANTLLSAAKNALARLAKDTGATLEKPVRLYIYASPQDMKGSMINPQEWTGGVNYSRYSIIVIGIAPNNLTWGTGAMAHELTHQIISQVTGNPYAGLPTWLDEGLAVNNEVPPAQDYQGIVTQAVAANALITVRSLASPFSANGNQAYLSYAESYSIVKFLIDKYHQPKMLELLKTFREGATYDGALKKVYGFDMDGLNSMWQQSMTATPRTVISVPIGTENLPATADVFAFGFSLSSPFIFIMVSIVKRVPARKLDTISLKN